MKRWAVRVLIGLGLFIAAVIIFLVVILNTGAFDHWARGYIVRKIESSLSTKAELQAFHFRLRGLSVELDGLTIHGRETAGLPPFFQAGRIRVAVHIISLFHRKISLGDVEIIQPSIFIRIDENGKSNVPTPPQKQPSKPWQAQLFNLQIAQLKITNGNLFFNDAKIPFDAEGQDFQFAMNYQAASLGKDSYFGQVSWNQVQITARRYLPFRFDIGSKFTLTRSAFSIDDLQLKLPHSTFNARGNLTSFKPFGGVFHYRGLLWLPDLRVILRKPDMPGGSVELAGTATYLNRKLTMDGDYHARGLNMRYPWFHAKGIESWGDIEMANGQLHLPVFYARAFGGNLKGKLEMNFKGLAFRTTSKLTGANLAQVLDAVDNPSLPVHTLHWSGDLEADTICTWNRDFKHFVVSGVTMWTPASHSAPRLIPTTAKINFSYVMDRSLITLKTPSTISTPGSHVSFSGTLGRHNSALQATFHTNRIEDWEDFIADLRGNQPGSDRITGAADWTGTISGPLTGPTFAGSFHAQDAHFGTMYWDDITGSMAYSPRFFKLSNAVVKRGVSVMDLDFTLQLHKWNFPKNGVWSLRASMDRASLSDLQGVFGTSYPVTATLTGNFAGSGTRRDPVLDGNFDLQNMTAYGIHVDRARGKLSLRHDYIQVSNAALDRGTGHLTGELTYKPTEKTVDFQTIGTGISLAQFSFLQSKSLPIAGDIDFDLRGSGPIASPQAHGTLQLVDLKFGAEVLDSFSGTLNSDGRTAIVDLQSIKTRGKLAAHFQMGLSDDYPLSGKITVKQIDLDPFITAGLHLEQLTGHSNIDGELDFSGDAKRPSTMVMQADLSQITFDYEFVKLHNQGPVRLRYGHNEVHVEPATLLGTDTNFNVSGTADFSGSRQLNLKIVGSINLRLASGLFSGLEARGIAQLNTTIAGTFSNPQVIGQAKIIKASAQYSDFPAGINNLNGEIVFDRSRMLLNNFTAETGGGTMKISGSVGYGARPVTYELNATATGVRLRTQGMSWLLDANLRFSGTSQGALLSGDATVQRVVFAPDVDFSSMLVSSHSTLSGPSTTSAYLRNLRFDISARAVPGMTIEWGSAHFTAEGGVRVRGTWEHPIVLGSIHLLSGEMAFHGNTYRLNRGDINFSNPSRFDPVLNIEIATTINPYEITLDFTGPASRMQVSYRSDPPLQSADIVNLLALGSQGEQSALMTSSSSQAQNFGATALLSEAVTSQIGAPIERLFGVTNFRIDPFLATSLANTGAVTQTTEARVTIEKQVTHDLSVTYSTNAASNQQQVIEVDYAIRRNITIVALRDINGIYGISIKFTNHFR